MELYEKLKYHRDAGPYPLHMPGHKRNMLAYEMENPYGLDITEIYGMDDLHAPEGILREGMDLAARTFGAEESWYLVNGSTAGILAGITACTRPGDTVLVARNCHRSVYHALMLRQRKPVYIMPASVDGWDFCGQILPETVEEMLETACKAVEEMLPAENRSRKPALVVLTSPTYEGILSDIPRIAQICHQYGVPLMVDEAHGAHLGFGRFPAGAVQGGADVGVQSLHKTLPAFTQTGLIHSQGTLVHKERIKAALDIYQSSSPSYILMAGIDRCVRLMAENKIDFSGWERMLSDFYARTACMHGLQVLDMPSGIKDPSKLVVSTARTGRTGAALMDLLRKEYGFELEMAAPRHVIAMTGAGDTAEKIEAFAEALIDIDRRWRSAAVFGEETVHGALPISPGEEALYDALPLLPQPKVVLPPGEAAIQTGRQVSAEAAEGLICLESVMAYPPGIPLIAPGERVTAEVLAAAESYRKGGISLRGMTDGMITVL